MALRDCRKLCPNSGHPLSNEAREQVAAGDGARRLRCEACGHVVDVRPDPDTGRMPLYAMHVRDAAAPAAGRIAR